MITRRTLAASIAIAPFAIGRARAAADFTYKFASNVPLTHPVNVHAKQAFDAIRKDSNGALDIQIFPSSQFGTDTDVLSQVRSGAVEFFTLSGLILSTLVPAASINGIGFAFPDYPAVWKAMDGDLGAHIRAEIGKVNLLAMDRIWDNGFRQITTSGKVIRGPGDLARFKIRVPVSPLWTSMFTALGAGPISINASELYSALQTHIADGQENPLSAVDTLKMYEVQKTCAMSSHMWDGFWFLANRRAWMTLPADLRTMAAKHINAAALDQRADIEKLNEGLKGSLESHGMVFNDVDKAAFRDKLRDAGFYKEWRGKYGPQAWSLLETYTGPLP